MTDQSKTARSRDAEPSVSQRWKSWWLFPIIFVLLGGVIWVAQIADGNAADGFGWFALMATIAAIYAFGGRFESIRLARGDLTDEREASINTRAMAATGTVLVVLLTSCIVYRLAQGENPSPYSFLMAVGGMSYVLSLLYLQFRS